MAINNNTLKPYRYGKYKNNYFNTQRDIRTIRRNARISSTVSIHKRFDDKGSEPETKRFRVNPIKERPGSFCSHLMTLTLLIYPVLSWKVLPDTQRNRIDLSCMNLWVPIKEIN